MGKELISFPDLATDLGGLDLLADSIRKSSGQDSNSDKDTFKAVVLRAVDGNRMRGRDVAGAVGASQVKNSTQVATITRAYFVRILEESPHSYLPDPCVQGGTGLAGTPNNHLIQSMHTFAIHQNSEKALAPNTVVFIKLNKRDFSYDTDIAWITGIVGHGGTEFAKEYKCVSPSDAYNKNEIFTVGGGASGPEDNRRDLDALHPEMKRLTTQLIANMRRRGYESQVITTWRSPMSQLEKVYQGRSKARFGYHNFVDSNGQPASQAVDLVDSSAGYGPDNPDDNLTAHRKAADYFKVLGQEAKKLGLSWGGDYEKSNPL